MVELNVNEMNTGVNIGNATVVHDSESDFLTITCRECTKNLGTFIGLENVVLVPKVLKSHEKQYHQ